MYQRLSGVGAADSAGRVDGANAINLPPIPGAANDNVWGGSGGSGGSTPKSKLGIGKGEQSLFQEAKKYKTAEEFVSSQGKVLFRGGKTDGQSFSTAKIIAEDFAKNRGGKVSEHILDLNAKIVKYNDVPKVKYKDITDDILDVKKDKLQFMEGELEQEFKKATSWAKENGYDAIQLPVEGEIRIINKNVIKTKTQLTDIWDKVNK